MIVWSACPKFINCQKNKKHIYTCRADDKQWYLLMCIYLLARVFNVFGRESYFGTMYRSIVYLVLLTLLWVWGYNDNDWVLFTYLFACLFWDRYTHVRSDTHMVVYRLNMYLHMYACKIKILCYACTWPQIVLSFTICIHVHMCILLILQAYMYMYMYLHLNHNNYVSGCLHVHWFLQVHVILNVNVYMHVTLN